MTGLLPNLDHLVFATKDVDATIVRLEQLMGVRAAIGGQHPAWGTRNALLSLGPQLYLEIMGPDPTRPEPAQSRPLGIDTISQPRLVTWVVRTDDIQRLVERARQNKLDLGEPQERSRTRPDGTVLEWTMTDLTKSRMGGIIPYFINWGNSEHPSRSSPKGCQLVKLDLSHPEAARATELLEWLGINVHVESGPFSLRATIESPKGQIVLE